MTTSFLRTTSLTAFVAMALAAACSNATDKPAPGGGQGVGYAPPVGAGGTSGTSGTSGGTSGTSGSSGVVDSGPPANLCDGAVQQGDIVGELKIVGSPPSPTGGAIAAGTYVLANTNSYGASQAGDAGDGGEQSGGGPTGISARSTLVVTGTTLRFFGARGPTGSLPADAVSGLSFKVNGNTLETTAFCPTAGAQKVIPFSGVSGAIVLFSDATHREVYRPR